LVVIGQVALEEVINLGDDLGKARFLLLLDLPVRGSRRRAFF